VEACVVTPSGGLLFTTRGPMVWDLVAGGRLLTTLSPHHKTVTSLCLSGTGKYLGTGSLDGQVHWINLASFKNVDSMQYPASVMAVGVMKGDNCEVASMLDGLVQFHTRKEKEVKDGMRTDTRRYKKMTSHRYLQHTAFTAGPGDQVVGQDSYDIKLCHDSLLRKYEYQRALDQVLMPYVVRKKPEYKFSLLMELSRREGLHLALAACEEKSLYNILQYIFDTRFTKLMVQIADLLLEFFIIVWRWMTGDAENAGKNQ
jgi:U3 small nucleolar RNA-associated protein 15